jgi:hypothetical protein
VERIEGGDDVTLAVQRLMNLAEERRAPSSTSPNKRIINVVLGPPTISLDTAGVARPPQQNDDSPKHWTDCLTRYSKIMVHMKGIPTAPFSRQEENILFGSFDILTDESVR